MKAQALDRLTQEGIPRPAVENSRTLRKRRQSLQDEPAPHPRRDLGDGFQNRVQIIASAHPTHGRKDSIVLVKDTWFGNRLFLQARLDRTVTEAPGKNLFRAVAPPLIGIGFGLIVGPSAGVAAFVVVLLVATRTVPGVPLASAALCFVLMAILDAFQQTSIADDLGAYAFLLITVGLVLVLATRGADLPERDENPERQDSLAR